MAISTLNCDPLKLEPRDSWHTVNKITTPTPADLEAADAELLTEMESRVTGNVNAMTGDAARRINRMFFADPPTYEKLEYPQ